METTTSTPTTSTLTTSTPATTTSTPTKSSIIYAISYDINDIDDFPYANNSIICCGIYESLDEAKNELKEIYEQTPDYKYYGYKIMVYELLKDKRKYKFINKIYTYSFDSFSEILLK